MWSMEAGGLPAWNRWERWMCSLCCLSVYERCLLWVIFCSFGYNLRPGCWGEYVELRTKKWQEVGEKCITSSFKIYRPHQMYGHYFIWQLVAVTSCGFLYLISAAHTSDHSYCRIWNLVVTRQFSNLPTSNRILNFPLVFACCRFEIRIPPVCPCGGPSGQPTT